MFLLKVLWLSSQPIHIVFRYDDFRLVNNPTNEKIVQIFQKHHIPLVLGVIPCDANENFVLDKNYSFLDSLKTYVHNGTVEIALHGFNHQKMTPYGEFKGLSFEEQNRRIHKGKNLLDSVFNVPIVSFIPPYNAHDPFTVRALKANQIYIVSSSVYDIWNELVFYPMSVDDFYRLQYLVNANKTYGGIIVVMLHPYNFKTQKPIYDLDRLLTNLQQDKAVSFNTFRELEAKGIYITKYQTLDQMKKNLLGKWLTKKGVFISDNEIVKIKIFNALLYLIATLLVYLISQYFILKQHQHNMVQYFVLLVFSIVVALSTWYFWLSPLKLLVLESISAVLLPFGFKIFKVYNFRLKIDVK